MSIVGIMSLVMLVTEVVMCTLVGRTIGPEDANIVFPELVITLKHVDNNE